MANVKISELSAAGTLDGTEKVAVVQGGVTKRTTTGAIAGTSGMTLLASGTIASPVANLDLSLSAGYSDFEIRLVGWQVDENGEDSLQYRLSFDGGSTYSTDAHYFTRYVHSSDVNSDPRVTAATLSGQTSGQIANGYPSPVASPGVGMTSTIHLFPGSASLYPTLDISNNTVYSNTENEFTWENAASAYASVGRADAIRLLTIGNNIFGGVYWIYGRPTP